LLRDRLRNQRLRPCATEDAIAVLRWFGAMQAQDYPGVKWAIGRRALHLRDRDVEAAFNDGAIVRTHVLRPTWHFVAAEDLHWMLALTGPRIHAMNRRYGTTLGLDERLFDRTRRVVERALESRPLTRLQISTELRRKHIDASGQQLAHLLLDLEIRRVICSGPRTGNQFTYRLVPAPAPGALLERDEALAALATRYFRSHGPATLKDFSWWSGLTMREARRGTEAAGTAVLPAPLAPDRVARATYLLPNYDEYLIAYRDRHAVLDPARARNFGVFASHEHPHQLVIDGRVAGSWRRSIDARSLRLDVRPYVKVSPAQRRDILREGARYGRFLGIAAEVHLES
jgi:hypothetical protein